MMLRATGILLKKEAHAFFSSFTRRQRTPDVVGKLLSFLLAAAIAAFACFALKRFAGMYLAIETGRVSDPYARLYELTTVIYTVITAVNALGAVRVINRSLFENEELRLLLTLPLPSGAVWLAKMAAAYVKQFVFGLFTVLPVNITLATCVPLGAQFYGMTALILVLLPMISLAVGSVLALPVHAAVRLISSRYVVTLVIVTVVTALAFWLYSVVLDFIANLVATGEARYFFDAETMRGIAHAVSRMYPAVFFSDMLLTDGMSAAAGWVILIAAALSALSLLTGRLMLRPAAQDRLFALNSRYVWKGRSMPAPRPKFLSFMKKEFLLVLRTPPYAFAYFSTAVIMPLMVYFCMDIFSELAGMLVLVDCDLEIAVFLIVMFGILTNTYCAGAVSRDGEFFFVMRTMPVDFRTVIGAKAAFCFIPSAAAAAASVGVVGGLGYVDAGQAVYLLAVTLAIAAAQICFAVRRDLARPRFGGADGREENETLSLLVIIGLLVSVAIGAVALYDGIYLKLSRGETYGETVSMLTVAAMAAALLAAGLAYLFTGLRARYEQAGECGV